MLTRSPKNVSPDIIQIHETTLPHLDMVEKILLDMLIEQGKAVVIEG